MSQDHGGLHYKCVSATNTPKMRPCSRRRQEDQGDPCRQAEATQDNLEKEAHRSSFLQEPADASLVCTGQMPSRKVRLTFKSQQGQPSLGPETKLSVSSKQNLPKGLGAGHEDYHVLGPTEGSAPVCTGFQLSMRVDSKTLCEAMAMF